MRFRNRRHAAHACRPPPMPGPHTRDGEQRGREEARHAEPCPQDPWAGHGVDAGEPDSSVTGQQTGEARDEIARGGPSRHPAPANQFANDRPTWQTATPRTTIAQTKAKGISHVHGYWSCTRSRCMSLLMLTLPNGMRDAFGDNGVARLQ